MFYKTVINNIILIIIIFVISGCSNVKKNKNIADISIPTLEVEVFLNRNSLLDTDFITSLLYNKVDNLLLIGTKKGLYSFKNNILKKIDSLSNENIKCMGFTNKRLFIASNKHLYRFNNKRLENKKNMESIRCLAWLNNIFIVGLNNGIAYFSNGEWHYLNEDNSIFSLVKNSKTVGYGLLEVNDIEIDKDNKIWIGTSDGLIILDEITSNKGRIFYADHKRPTSDNDLEIIPGNSDLAGNYVEKIFIDNNGVWIGTGKGINYISDINSVWDIYRGPHTELVVENGKFVDKFVKGNSGMVGNWVKDIIKYEDWIIIGTTKGISAFNIKNNKWKGSPNDYRLENIRVNALEIYKNNLFIATNYGLYKLNLVAWLGGESEN